jgi:hypothetical protein
MQFYANVRERDNNPGGLPRYPRGPIDTVPFEAAARANPARGSLTQWASYTLQTAGTLAVTGLRLDDVPDANHALVTFSEPVGDGAANAANYALTDLTSCATIPVVSAQVLAEDPAQVRLETALPGNTRVRVTVGNVRAGNGATLSDALNTAEMAVATRVVFNLYDPYGAYSTYECPSGAPCAITVTGDMTGFQASADGTGEIPLTAVAGAPNHYRSAPIIVSPRVITYKYRLPKAGDAPDYPNWNALNPHDRFFFVPETSALVETADNAANNTGGYTHNGGPARAEFTLVDRDNVAHGRAVYLTGDLTGWSADPGAAIPMLPVPGEPNTYRASFTVPNNLGVDTTTRYKYILKPDAQTTLWDDLNPLGDRWTIFRGSGDPPTQTVRDILGGDRVIEIARVAAGLEAAPMFSAYYAADDLDRSGAVNLVDVVLAQRSSGPLPRLVARGTGIVDAAGRPAKLRGINLGGWLVEEMWMTPWVTDPPSGSPYGKVEDHVTLWNTLNQRLGAEAAQTVKAAWRNTWVTSGDFTRIKAAGFNHVRLPFLWDIIEEPGGWDWLRNAVADANAAGLYVLLDMHGAPGGQNAWDHSGRTGQNEFFSSPANIAKGVETWTAIARAFGSNPGVVGFDILNEPAGAPDAATLFSVSNQLYQAIRGVAPDTMIFIEDGYKGFGTMPMPAQYGWKNVVYSIHIYNFGATTPEDHAAALSAQMPSLLQVRAARNVPLYIGEFSVEPHSTPDAMAAFLKVLNDNGLYWAPWTWKTVAASGRMGQWGYYSNAGAVTPLNPFTDSAATLTTKMSQVRTESLGVPAGLAPVFTAATRD